MQNALYRMYQILTMVDTKSESGTNNSSNHLCDPINGKFLPFKFATHSKSKRYSWIDMATYGDIQTKDEKSD